MFKYSKFIYYLKKFRYFFIQKEPYEFYMSKRERPSLEISVKVGCGLMCTYCPQGDYIKSYKSNYPDEFKVLTKEVFLDCMKNISTNVLIKWTGFTEPLYSKDFEFFCEYLYNNGYEQSISTTLKGTKNSVDWFVNHAYMFNLITLHLPDEEGLMKCKVDEEYISNFESLISNPGTPLDRVSFFLIGESFENNLERIISKYVEDRVVDTKMVIKAEVLNTRNSTVTLDSSGLDNIKFRSKVKKVKSENFYCAYRRLNQGVLLPNGEVSLCCQDYKLEYILGDLKTQNLDNLYKKIQDSDSERKHFTSGSFFPCSSCEHYRPLSNEYTGNFISAS